MQDFNLSDLKQFLKLPKVVGLGEIGLDFSSKNRVDKKLQEKVFLQQLHLALELNMPICLHIREADEDGLSLLEKAQVPKTHPIHLHCFNSSWKVCQAWMKRFSCLKIGFTPLIMFDNVQHLHEVVRKIPLERVLLETDSPYFLNRRLKSKIGMTHPGLVVHVAKEIATIKAISLDEVLVATDRNIQEVYGISSTF